MRQQLRTGAPAPPRLPAAPAARLPPVASAPPRERLPGLLYAASPVAPLRPAPACPAGFVRAPPPGSPRPAGPRVPVGRIAAPPGLPRPTSCVASPCAGSAPPPAPCPALPPGRCAWLADSARHPAPCRLGLAAASGRLAGSAPLAGSTSGPAPLLHACRIPAAASPLPSASSTPAGSPRPSADSRARPPRSGPSGSAPAPLRRPRLLRLGAPAPLRLAAPRPHDRTSARSQPGLSPWPAPSLGRLLALLWLRAPLPRAGCSPPAVVECSAQHRHGRAPACRLLPGSGPRTRPVPRRCGRLLRPGAR
ncbi:hypothetical protein ACQJBY_006877 [Aegilops geniculata]